MTDSQSRAPIRLGYVGCGFMAQHVHLPNYATLPQCRLLAIAERRPQLALAVASRFAVERVYSNHLELAADPQIDAVGVSANYAQQGEIAADLLKAGKHVFMEKPMAISVLQAEKILEAAHQGRTRLMVAFMKRFDPGNVLARMTIRQWLDDGTKGRLLYARNHGFQGHWLNGLSQFEPFTNTVEPIEAFDAASLFPTWLPQQETGSYLAFVQQYVHNLNFAQVPSGRRSTGQNTRRNCFLGRGRDDRSNRASPFRNPKPLRDRDQQISQLG
jgi:predicted dehydrogenase